MQLECLSMVWEIDCKRESKESVLLVYHDDDDIKFRKNLSL